jgi:hypothetical protein
LVIVPTLQTNVPTVAVHSGTHVWAFTGLKRGDGTVHTDVGCETILTHIHKVSRFALIILHIHTLDRVLFLPTWNVTTNKWHIWGFCELSSLQLLPFYLLMINN